MDSPLMVFYGGTFDPVHNGHLAIARAARDELHTTIRLMPAADPPHRAPPGAAGVHRARMLDLAVAGERGLVVDRREFSRGSRSYSLDTLREARVEHGGSVSLALLLGADSFAGLPSWKGWQDLFELAHFVVAEREGHPVESGLSGDLEAMVAGRWTRDPADLHKALAGRVLPLRQPLHEGSATQVRASIAAGLPWRQLVPAAVAGYIDRHHLYT